MTIIDIPILVFVDPAPFLIILALVTMWLFSRLLNAILDFIPFLG
jgi:hypothetical protein